MPRFQQVCVLILCISWIPVAFGQKQITSTYRNANGDRLPYSFFVPKGFDEPNNRFPLIVNLGTAPQELASVARGDDYPAFLLSGNDLNGRPALTVELINQLESEYGALDPERRFITGWSSGGFGTFDLIAQRPDFFDAAVPISAGYNPDLIAPSVRLWAFHGRGDGVVNVNRTRVMVQAWHEADAAPLYLELSQKAHEIQDDVLSMPALYDWLFNETPPPINRLLYNPSNGNLRIDASPDGLWSILFASELELGESLVDEIDGSPLTNANNRLKYQSTIDAAFDGQLDLGNLLPQDLDYVTLHEAVRAQYKPTGQNANRDFMFHIVPEPNNHEFLFPLLILSAVFYRHRKAGRAG